MEDSCDGGAAASGGAAACVSAAVCDREATKHQQGVSRLLLLFICHY